MPKSSLSECLAYISQIEDYVSYTITESIEIRDVCVYIVCLDGKLSVSKSNSAGLYTRGYDMYFLKHSDAGFG